MKKFFTVSVLAFVFVLTGCFGGNSVDFTVGLVTDTGGIDDKSFNQSTWEGIELFAEDNDMEETENYKYLQSTADADYLPNISTFADEELDLIVMPGFLFESSLITAAEQYPNQKFLLIDAVVQSDNVVSAVFAEHQGSFLVGVAAALKAEEAEETKVGFIGGMDFPLIQKFEAGFIAGVLAVNPEITVVVSYVGDFQDSQLGQTIAAMQYDDGAYVIYHAAGGAGNGVIKEAKDRRTNGEDVWAIGVDKDQFEQGVYNDDGDSAVLTSMMKRVDVAAYDVTESVFEDTWVGGETLLFDLTNNGVDLPEINPNLTTTQLSTIEDYKQDIIDGVIVVPSVPVE